MNGKFTCVPKYFQTLFYVTLRTLRYGSTRTASTVRKIRCSFLRYARLDNRHYAGMHCVYPLRNGQAKLNARECGWLVSRHLTRRWSSTCNYTSTKFQLHAQCFPTVRPYPNVRLTSPLMNSWKTETVTY